MLEGSRCIGKSKGHYTPLVRSVMGPEGGFWFVTFSDADEVVSVSEINLCIHTGFPRSVQQVGDKRKWVAILLRDPVETMEVHT